LREELPQIAEHSFGYHAKTQTTVDNPSYAVMLGIRRFSWMNYDQAKLRIFSWSAEYANDPAPCHSQLVIDTLLEMEELELITLVLVATVVDRRPVALNKLDKQSQNFGVLEIRDANFRFTKRYNRTNNTGDV